MPKVVGENWGGEFGGERGPHGPTPIKYRGPPWAMRHVAWPPSTRFPSHPGESESLVFFSGPARLAAAHPSCMRMELVSLRGDRPHVAWVRLGQCPVVGLVSPSCPGVGRLCYAV